jgi:hypothetical protein
MSQNPTQRSQPLSASAPTPSTQRVRLTIKDPSIGPPRASPAPPPSSQPTPRPPKASQTSRSRVEDWATDARPGGESSLELLLTWLEIPGNPNRYRHGTSHRKSGVVLEEISAWLRDNGAPVERKATACGSKVRPLFRFANDSFGNSLRLGRMLTRL